MFEIIVNHIGEMQNRTDSYHCINLLTDYSCFLTSWVKCERNKLIEKILKVAIFYFTISLDQFIQPELLLMIKPDSVASHILLKAWFVYF